MERHDGLNAGRDTRIPDPVPSLDGNLGAWGASSQLSYNPLNVSVGAILKLHDRDFDRLEVAVTQVLGTVVTHEGRRYEITDYVLIGSSSPETDALADSDGNVRLRLRCSQDERDNLDATVFQAQHFEQQATHIFKDLAVSQGRVSLRNVSGEEEHGFERIDGVRDIYRGQRVVVGGDGSDGSAVTREIETLDYSREQSDVEGGRYTQWALVEHNPDTHDMITLFGWSIDPYSIERVGR